MIKNLLFTLLIIQFVLTTASCTNYEQQLEITDLKKSHVLLLHKIPSQKNVYSMGIHCYGKLDGEAELVLMLNGAQYKIERLKGKVNFTWSGDWYSDSMELRYQPGIVSAGQLFIEYTFTD